MGLIASANKIHFVACDDPHGVGCRTEAETVRTPWAASNAAIHHGWRQHPTTGRWTCPGCQNLQPALVATRLVKDWVAAYGPTLQITTEQADRLRPQIETRLRRSLAQVKPRGKCR